MLVDFIYAAGAKVTVDLKSIKTSRNALTGELTKIEWIPAEGATAKIQTLNIQGLAAIIVHETPTDKESESP